MIRNHLRNNVVGYVAIFLFAIGGTAYATHPGGANTISTGDIINGEVKTADIGNNEVTDNDTGPNSVNTGDIVDGAVTQAEITEGAVRSGEIANNKVQSVDLFDGAVTSADVLDDSLGTADIGTDGVDDDEVASLNGDANIDDNTLTTFDIATNAIDSDEVVDGGLFSADVNQFWAVINADGTVARDSEFGAVTVTHSAGAGSYIVNFGRNIENCSFVGTIGLSGSSGTSARGFITVVGAAASPTDSIFVTTDDITGASAERGFHLQVSC